MSDSFQPDEAALLADVIERLEWQVDHSSSRRIGFAEYRHCRMLLEMVEELENQLDDLQHKA